MLWHRWSTNQSDPSDAVRIRETADPVLVQERPTNLFTIYLNPCRTSFYLPIEDCISYSRHLVFSRNLLSPYSTLLSIETWILYHT